MCFYARHATSSRRRPLRRRQTSSMPPLALLDLSKPAERQAHDFLCRSMSKRDQMWTIFNTRRHGGVLLCVVRWVHPDEAAKPFALAEVSLTDMAVCWRDYATAEVARAELVRRCAAPAAST